MIKRLEKSVSNFIASTQVITELERVVTELIDNSLDANSTDIKIYFREFGKERIDVQDNGVGISLDDANLLGLQGCTSKKLDTQTIGFKGEALFSLSQLGDVSIISRQISAENAFKLDIVNDRKLETTSREPGTSISLFRLFEKIPVRRIEFVNSLNKHFKKTLEAIEEYALCWWNVRFTVYNDSKVVFYSGDSTNTLRKRVSDLLGTRLENMLVEETSEEDYSGNNWKCFFTNRVESGSKIEASFIKRTKVYFFVNKKPISPPKKLLKGFGEIFLTFNNDSKFMVFVFVSQSFETKEHLFSKDKREIVLHDEEELVKSVLAKVKSRIETLSSIPKIIKRRDVEQEYSEKKIREISNFSQSQSQTPLKPTYSAPALVSHSNSFKNSTEKPFSYSASQSQTFRNENHCFDQLSSLPRSLNFVPMKEEPRSFIVRDYVPPTLLKKEEDFGNLVTNSKMSLEESDSSKQKIPVVENVKKLEFIENFGSDIESQPFDKSHFSELKIIGQFNKGFIVSFSQELEDLFIIDQHAANEKFLYEKFLNESNNLSQALIQPLEIHLDHIQMLITEEKQKKLEERGFRFQLLEDKIRISSVPVRFGRAFGTQEFFDLIEEDLDSADVQLRVVKEKAASKACRKAVMVGDPLNQQQMTEIVANLKSLESPWGCPHGRPTFVKTEKLEILMNNILFDKNTYCLV